MLFPRSFLMTAGAVATAFAMTGPAAAGVLFDNGMADLTDDPTQPRPGGWVLSDQTPDYIAADDFLLDADATVTGITFQVLEEPNTVWSPLEIAYQIRVDAAGIPGASPVAADTAALTEDDRQNVSVPVVGGTGSRDFDLVTYSLVLDELLTGGTYWLLLETFATSGGSYAGPNVFWAYNTQLNGILFSQNGGTLWQNIPAAVRGGGAFRVEGEPIPLPSSLLLVGLGLLGGGFSRRIMRRASR
jgi:hypothetical protein